MRRVLTYLVVAVVVGGAVGTLMSRDPGYVLVTYADMSFETSLWFALLALLVGYFLLRTLVAAWRWIARGASGAANWRQNRQERTARARTMRGLLLAGEGDWVAARKALETDADASPAPWVNYVVAARAANELNDAAGRDALLERAGQAAPGSALAVALTRAELQIASDQHRAAVETLLNAKATAPNHPRLLALLARCYEALGDWGALLPLTAELRRRGVFDAAAATDLERRALLGCFEQAPDASVGAPQRLMELWKEADKILRGDPELVVAYARALERAGAVDDAEAAVAAAIRQNPDDNLVALYGRLRGRQPERQLRVAEGWLKERPNDPTLLLALGRLALASGSAPKAREYFEASLKQQRGAEVYAELGRACLTNGESARAAELFAQAVELSGELPALPTASPAASGS